MLLHDLCLAIRCANRDLQELDTSYKSYGESFPEFKSSWDDKISSLVITKFGSIPNPRWVISSSDGSKKGLKDYFMDAMEARYCRRNYQQSIDMFEDILDDAISKHGEEKLVGILQRQLFFFNSGAVDSLTKAGIHVRDEVRLKSLFGQSEQIDLQRAQSQENTAIHCN